MTMDELRSLIGVMFVPINDRRYECMNSKYVSSVTGPS